MLCVLLHVHLQVERKKEEKASLKARSKKPVSCTRSAQEVQGPESTRANFHCTSDYLLHPVA